MICAANKSRNTCQQDSRLCRHPMTCSGAGPETDAAIASIRLHRVPAQFLGRDLDPHTMTYGSDALPIEMAFDVSAVQQENSTQQGGFWPVVSRIEEWKARLASERIDQTDPMPTPEEAMSWVPLWLVVVVVLGAVLLLAASGVDWMDLLRAWV